MCNCKDKVQLQGALDAIVSPTELDEILPMQSNGTRAMNINIKIDWQNAAMIFAVALTVGIVLKKM
jgi:hypothetical protein